MREKKGGTDLVEEERRVRGMVGKAGKKRGGGEV